MPSKTAANGSVAAAPAPICTAVTATGSRPASRRGCATTYAAEASAEASIRPSPNSESSPPDPATSPTPAIARVKPTHDCGVALDRPRPAAMSATKAGTAARISAAWVTLVFWIAVFCSITPRP
jgi:hypothetical protein